MMLYYVNVNYSSVNHFKIYIREPHMNEDFRYLCTYRWVEEINWRKLMLKDLLSFIFGINK